MRLAPSLVFLPHSLSLDPLCPFFFTLFSLPNQVRADLNVPLDKDLKITDDTRIRAAIPTLKYLVDNGAKVLLTSHLGRPKDGPEDKFRLNPVVPRLQELLKGTKVSKVDDCIGDKVAAAAKALGNGALFCLSSPERGPSLP